MTRAQVIERIHRKTGVDRPAVKAVVDQLFPVIIQSVSEGDAVTFRGFGAFGSRYQRPKKGHNMHTGETIDVPGKMVPMFKPSGEFKKQITESRAIF